MNGAELIDEIIIKGAIFRERIFDKQKEIVITISEKNFQMLLKHIKDTYYNLIEPSTTYSAFTIYGYKIVHSVMLSDDSIVVGLINKIERL